MKKFSGSAIARHQVFMLADGTFVVQWDDKRIQDILSGKYREFDYRADFGHAITDYELRQLRAAGRVEHFNRQYVWLYALPESGRFGQRRVLGRGNRVRAYYLSTPFAKTQIGNIQSMFDELDVSHHFSVRVRDDSVVILGDNGVPFRTIEDAEDAQQFLGKQAPGILSNLVVAFVETSVKHRMPIMSETNETLNLDDIIASQSNKMTLNGRHIVVAVKNDEERQAFSKLFEEMNLDVKYASSASDAIHLLEDNPSDLLIIDIDLPDMHGWQMLSKIREIETLRDLPIMVITEQTNFGMTVAKVNYIQRPISIARLRHNIWTTLSGREEVSPTEMD